MRGRTGRGRCRFGDGADNGRAGDDEAQGDRAALFFISGVLTTRADERFIRHLVGAYRMNRWSVVTRTFTQSAAGVIPATRAISGYGVRRLGGRIGAMMVALPMVNPSRRGDRNPDSGLVDVAGCVSQCLHGRRLTELHGTSGRPVRGGSRRHRRWCHVTCCSVCGPPPRRTIGMSSSARCSPRLA